jgi:hypothetical protein
MIFLEVDPSITPGVELVAWARSPRRESQAS